jgi:hypothetical protein
MRLKILSAGTAAAVLGIVAGSLAQVTAGASGATSSGGGNGISNRSNPWFLENTTRVNYCVDVHEEDMGVTQEEGAQMVRRALDYWIANFAAARSDWYNQGQIVPFGQVRLATQQFLEVPCPTEDAPQPDIRFQLGSLLPTQQITFGGDNELIGVAMRTDYDNQSMRGKGFVYVSPQSGPNRSLSIGFSQEAWSTCGGCLLELVLKHEVGHVFGVQHSTSEVTADLMSAKLPAYLTLDSTVKEIKESPALGSFLSAVLTRPYFSIEQDPLLVSDVEESKRHEFGLSEQETHVQLRPQNPIETGSLVVEAFKWGTPERRIVARVCPFENYSGGTTSGPIMDIFLPSDQRVFHTWPRADAEHPQILRISHSQDKEVDMQASLCFEEGPLSGHPVPMALSVTKTHGRLTAVIGGKLHPKYLTEFPGSRFHLPGREVREDTPSQPIENNSSN